MKLGAEPYDNRRRTQAARNREAASRLFCILALAALQFVIAYQDIHAAQMFRRMLSVALVEAGVAVMFFMHLWAEKRAFLVVCSGFHDFRFVGYAVSGGPTVPG